MLITVNRSYLVCAASSRTRNNGIQVGSNHSRYVLGIGGRGDSEVSGNSRGSRDRNAWNQAPCGNAEAWR